MYIEKAWDYNIKVDTRMTNIITRLGGKVLKFSINDSIGQAMYPLPPM